MIINPDQIVSFLLFNVKVYLNFDTASVKLGGGHHLHIITKVYIML